MIKFFKVNPMEMGLMGIIFMLACMIIIKTIMIMSIWRSAMLVEIDAKDQKSLYFPGDLFWKLLNTKSQLL